MAGQRFEAREAAPVGAGPVARGGGILNDGGRVLNDLGRFLDDGSCRLDDVGGVLHMFRLRPAAGGGFGSAIGGHALHDRGSVLHHIRCVGDDVGGIAHDPGRAARRVFSSIVRDGGRRFDDGRGVFDDRGRVLDDGGYGVLAGVLRRLSVSRIVFQYAKSCAVAAGHR